MKKEAVMPKAFLSEAEFEEAYEKFLGNLPSAGKRIMDSHDKMEVCFRDYLDAFERWVFRQAYEDGYAAAVSKIGDMDKKTAETSKKYQVSSSFGHHLYENEHDAIQTVMMLAPCYGMEILEGEVKAYLDIHGCYNAFPIVVQRCDF